MTPFQAFALIGLPLIVMAIGYMLVLQHERWAKRHDPRNAQSSNLDVGKQGISIAADRRRDKIGSPEQEIAVMLRAILDIVRGIRPNKIS